jgi:hypothetical protein
MHISADDYRGAIAAASLHERIARSGFSINGYPLWSAAEDQTLRRAYPNYAAAKRRLPRRTRGAIKSHAKRLGIQRRRYPWTDDDFAKLRRVYPVATKQELMAAFPGRTFYALESMAHCKHIRKQRRPFQKTGDHLIDAVRERARGQGYTMTDLDEIAKTGAFFQLRAWNHCVHRAYQHLYRAVEALDGEMLPPTDAPIPDRALPRLPRAADRARLIPPRKHWTAGEVSRLRKVYSWAPVETLLDVLPGRSFAQIKRMASRYGLRRRQPKPIGHPLFDYLRRKAHEQGYTMVALDRVARSRTPFFSNPSRRRRMNNGALGRAAEALKVLVQLNWR